MTHSVRNSASLAVVAMVILGTTNLRAQNSTANTAAPAIATDRGFTHEVLNKLLAVNASYGIDRELGHRYATALGLGTPGQPWPERGIAATTTPGLLHGFAIGRGGDQDVVFTVDLPNSIHQFRARRDGKLVAGYVYLIPTRQIDMLAPDEAQKELDIELAFWIAGILDRRH